MEDGLVREEIDALAAILESIDKAQPPLPASSIGYFSVLPFELHLYMLQFAEAKELLRLRQVCSHFKSITRESLLWKRLVERLWYRYPKRFRNTANRGDANNTTLVHNRLFERFGKTWEWLYRSKALHLGIVEYRASADFYREDSKREPLIGNKFNPGSSVQEGEWQDNVLHGYGIVISEDGLVVEGEWKKGVMDGYGRVQGVDGGEYEGEFKNNKRHGKGEYRWRDGSVFSGIWDNDQQEGRGVHKRVDGVVLRGTWHQGQCHGNWIAQTPTRVNRYYSQRGRGNGVVRVYHPKGEFSQAYREGWRVGKRVVVKRWNEEKNEGWYPFNDEDDENFLGEANTDQLRNS